MNTKLYCDVYGNAIHSVINVGELGGVQIRFVYEYESQKFIENVLGASYQTLTVRQIRNKLRSKYNIVQTKDVVFNLIDYVLVEKDPTSKICLQCEDKKDISKFKANKISYDGYENYCRDCVAEKKKIVCQTCNEKFPPDSFRDSKVSPTGKVHSCVLCESKMTDTPTRKRKLSVKDLMRMRNLRT